MIQIARVVASQGIRGEVRIALDTDFPERFTPPLDVALVKGERSLDTEVVTFWRRKSGAVVSLRGLDDRNAAESWVGARLLIPEERRWPLPEGALYIDDVLGLTAVASGGQTLGKVTGVVPMPAHDLYEIDGGRYLVPAHHEWAAIDLEAKVLRVLRPLEVEGDAD